MRKLLAAALLAALAASPLLIAPARAQTPIKIMVGGIDKQIYLPAKLAAQLGFFKEQGLDVELFNSTSGSQAATALLAREVQGVVGFYDHTIDLQSKGKFITSVVQFGIAPGEVVLVKAADADKLRDPANWKGQALGVTGLGSATDFLTRALAAELGPGVTLLSDLFYTNQKSYDRQTGYQLNSANWDGASWPSPLNFSMPGNSPTSIRDRRRGRRSKNRSMICMSWVPFLYCPDTAITRALAGCQRWLGQRFKASSGSMLIGK